MKAKLKTEEVVMSSTVQESDTTRALPNTERLAAERARWVAAGAAGRAFFVDRAEGAMITDVDGREFIDFVGGVGTNNLGHRHPEVIEAIKDQLDRYLHQCFSLSAYEPYVEVCRLLALCHPGRFEKRALLVNSGAEAVENAIKIARYYTGRQAVICLDNAFHGRTLLTMTLTAKVRPYKLGFGPFAPEVYRATGPHEFRGISSDDAIAGLHRLLKNQVDPTQVAAIIFEPVQGEGGFLPMPADYPARVAELAAEHGILIIADEVQSGMGRTGLPAAIGHYGVHPDLMTWGKSMGGGLPIAGVSGRAEIMDSVHPGGIGGTFGGNPLSCAAARVAIERVLDPAFQQSTLAFGRELRDGLEKVAADHPCIGEVRGLGAMLALELVDADGRPDAEVTARIIAEAFDRGLILMAAGLDGNVIRILVPVVADDETVRRGLDILAASIEAATTTTKQGR